MVRLERRDSPGALDAAKLTEAHALTYATVDLTREDHDGYYNGIVQRTMPH
jgi:hypothetical protein